MNQNGFTPIAIILFIAAAILAGGVWYYASQTIGGFAPEPRRPVATPSLSITTSSTTEPLQSASSVAPMPTPAVTASSSSLNDGSKYTRVSKISLQTIASIDLGNRTFSATGCGPACQSEVNTTFQVYPTVSIYREFKHTPLTLSELKVGDIVDVFILTDNEGRILMDGDAMVAKEISVQTPLISITGISPSSTPVNSQITISGSGFSSVADVPLGGDSYGDGIWLYNGKYSAELYGSGTKIVSDNTIVTAIPATMCPGQESNACSSNSAIPITAGIWSIYIKVDNGTMRSGYGTFTITPF